jgi:hypothetical protein
MTTQGFVKGARDSNKEETWGSVNYPLHPRWPRLLSTLVGTNEPPSHRFWLITGSLVQSGHAGINTKLSFMSIRYRTVWPSSRAVASPAMASESPARATQPTLPCCALRSSVCVSLHRDVPGGLECWGAHLVEDGQEPWPRRVSSYPVVISSASGFTKVKWPAGAQCGPASILLSHPRGPNTDT